MGPWPPNLPSQSVESDIWNPKVLVLHKFYHQSRPTPINTFSLMLRSPSVFAARAEVESVLGISRLSTKSTFADACVFKTINKTQGLYAKVEVSNFQVLRFDAWCSDEEVEVIGKP